MEKSKKYYGMNASAAPNIIFLSIQRVRYATVLLMLAALIIPVIMAQQHKLKLAYWGLQRDEMQVR
jgi:hypothetical protein